MTSTAVTSIEHRIKDGKRPNPWGYLVFDEKTGELWIEKLNVDPARHLHRNSGTYSIDAERYSRLRCEGAVGIRLRLVDGGVLEARNDVLDVLGYLRNDGAGLQRSLRESDWTRVSG